VQFQRDYILSDGQKLAVSWPQADHCLILSEYAITDIQHSVDTVHVTCYGHFPKQMVASEMVDISIRSCGHFQVIAKSEADKLFASIDSMSVNDLLAAIYRKMNERQP
jgi:hypothetical protein